MIRRALLRLVLALALLAVGWGAHAATAAPIATPAAGCADPAPAAPALAASRVAARVGAGAGVTPCAAGDR